MAGTKTTLAALARTPAPPYYSVTTTTEFAAGFDRQAYFRVGARLYESARGMEGFLGLEAFFDGDASVAISYWDSLEAIERWRRDAGHEAAKDMAKRSWFGPTLTRIARVDADYGFHLGVRGNAAAGGASGEKT